MVQAADMLALPPDTEVLHLIQLFFSDTGMLFPYIHKDSVLNTFAEARESNFASVRRSWLCLLNMILAFATCVSARPDLPVEQNAAASEVFCRRAQALAGNFAFKPANIEIGMIPINESVPLGQPLKADSSILAPHDPVSPGNSEISTNLEPSRAHCKSRISTWTTHGYSVLSLHDVGEGNTETYMVRLCGA